MTTLADMAIFLIRTIGSLYLLIVLLRFLLQLVRADFYNPISQGISAATNPVLLPLRRVIPGIYGIDLASLVLAFFVQWIAGQFILLCLGGGCIITSMIIHSVHN